MSTVIEQLPTTAAQRELWTASRLGDDASVAFNEVVAITLDGVLHVDALRQAIRQVVARHDALRARVTDDGRTLELLSVDDVRIEEIDASGLDAAATRAALARHERTLVERPFELSTGPLVRFAVVRCAPEQHVLTIAAHHIVCDGWSFGVLARDLGAAYSAARSGGTPTWPAADRLATYEAALADEARSDEMAAAEGYWIDRFREVGAPLELPTDHVRPPVRHFASAREELVLDAPLVERLKRSAASQGSTLFATLLTGFAALVARLSQQDDIVIGIPVAAQARLGLPELVGHCVNLLPLRLHPEPTQAIAQFAADVRRTLFDALDHQQLTYGALLTQLPIRRDPSRLPLVSVVFNLDRGIGDAQLGFAGLRGQLRSVPRSAENFELFLNAVELDGAVTLELQYSAALFDASTMRRWLSCYQLLLEGAVATPDRALEALPWVPADDRALMADWAGEVRIIDETRLVHHRIADVARRVPQATAVTSVHGARSYAALDGNANRLARALREAGAAVGGAVGVLLPRDARMPEAWLAVSRSGAAYVPLDPDLPQARLHLIATDAELTQVVTTTALRSLLPATLDVPVIDLDEEVARLAALDDAPLAPSPLDATADTTAFVIYTSGSTGTPKGCRNSHRGLLAFLEANAPETAPAAGGVMLALAAVSFDASVGEQALTLTAGARLVIVPREVAADGARLSSVMAAEGVTFMFATPATYRLLLSAEWTGSRGLTVACGGEAMTPDLAEALVARTAAAWNVYGPTETAIWLARKRLSTPPGRITIGGPMANTRFEVLDRLGAPVPIGVPGELWIGGPHVALGYHQRPTLTASAFQPDPQGSRRDAKRYRTGDVVRWVAPGEIEYVGRNDDQVKLRGYRIELGEIATRLMEQPTVARALVRVREDVPGDQRLVAYLTAAGGAVPEESALRTALGAVLPSYMIPQAFVILDAFPLLPSGKINLHALPAPSSSAAELTRAYRAPTTAREREIAASWARALRVARVSVDDDFFELGGHSLLASHVLADLRTRHALDVPYRLFFEAPTVARLADAIEAMVARGEQGPVVAPIVHRIGNGAAPVSVAQRRLWMLEALDPANRMVMAHSAAWTLTGALDASLLEMALRDVIARHGSLRTRFEEIDGALQQVIEPDVPFALHRHDLRHLSGAALEAEVARRFAHFHDRPFDLAAPPLFRALLIQVGAAEHRFYTMQHVLIWDGWSFDLFLADLAAAYTGRRAGHAPAWEPLPISYADYAIWQQEQLQSAAMESRRGWWDAHLAGELPVVELPTDRPRPAQSSYAGDRITMRLTGADVEAVRRAAQREGVTLFQYLFTAFQVLLHRYSGQRDLMIGIPLRNRSRSEVEGVIGSFVNTVAIRSQVDPEMPFAELLTQVKQSCVAALEHQDVPFELLDRRAPAVRVLFSMQDARERPPALDDCRIEQFTLAEHTAANDLMLWTMEYPSSLLIVLSYRTDLFDAETAQAMVEQFVSVVRDAERAPRTPLADFALAAGGRSMPRRLPEPEPAWFSTPTAWSRALTAIGMRKGDTVVVRCRADADRVALTRAAFAASVTVAHLAHDDSDGYTRTVLEQVGARLLVSDEPLAECPIAQVSPAALGDAAVSLPADAMAPPTVAALTIITADAPLPHVQQVTPTQVTTHVAALAQALRLGDSDVMLDASVSGSGQLPIFALAAASVGATRVGIDSEPAHDGASLVALLEATPCSIMVLPGSAVRGLAAVDWTGRASLRVILTSTCSADDTQWLATRVSELALAEYAVGVAGPVALTALPVGSTVVLDGIAPAVVGESGGDQPVGVPGVVQWTALTTAITGWSARRRRDGRVVLGTRPVDDLVIGDRAWDRAALGRVMAAALGATEATLAVHHDAAGAARLVGYLVSARDASDSERRRQLRSVLPARAIPPFFVPLDSLPITARGALDLTALPNPYGSRVPLAQRAAPATDDERLLAALWCEMLGVTTVARHDNFFALGGYSLLAFQLLDRVEESTGRRLNPRGLLFGTLEQVAATLAATAPTVPVSSAAAPVAARSRGVLSRWRRWIGAENSGHPSGTAGERPE